MVVARAGIEIAAGCLGLPGDCAHAPPGRALEEHVLQHVRDADPMVRLVEETRLHMSDDRHNWCGMIRLNQKREAVREDFAVDIFGPDG
jgi:hypothetical protein